MMQPVPANTLTLAIVEMMKADGRFDGVNIERSGLLNEDPDKCPWVGIYRDNVQFTPRGVGYGPGRMYESVELVFICQESDPLSGGAAEDAHETLIANVLDLMLGDPTLKGAVQTILLGNLRYTLIQSTDDQLLQQAEIHFIFQTVTK